MLRAGSPTLRPDVKLAVADLITLSGSASAEYFELRGRDWSEFLIIWYIGKTGRISMSAFYDIINMILSADSSAGILSEMKNSPDADVRRTANEMESKRNSAEREYSAIIGEILKSISFLSDPAAYDTLNGEDFSLEVLCKEDCNVYLIIPAEYLAQLAPMIRAIVGAAMLYKFRHPKADRILFIIDEAATLGRFESLLRAYTYGRGMGIRAWSIWQNVEQISRNFGPDAISAFIGSSQVRQFFGVRDLDTARMLSAMLGTQTLEYDDELAQAAAELQKSQILHEILMGGDPIQASLNYRYHSFASDHLTKQPRLLLTPDEILNMPEDRQILYISGLNLKPVYANKYPYFTRREMAGSYLPNPYHKPTDRVRIAGRFWSHWVKVVTEPVPKKYAHLPQYQSGNWSYVKGFRFD